MRARGRVVGNATVTAIGLAVGVLTGPASAATAHLDAKPASAAQETVDSASMVLSSLVAYVRAGDIYVSRNAAEKRLTTGGGFSRPRWAPDGKQIAFLKDGQLWTMSADGSGRRRLSTRGASGPSWSPDSKAIAFASPSCTGGPGVYQISASTAKPTEKVIFPLECRDQPLPAAPTTAAPQKAGGAPRTKAAPVTEVAPVGSLTDRLRTDDAVAWSPDGTKVAFRGGDCESVYDACLSIGTVATGAEEMVAAYGGGSLQNHGFAVVPSWRPDGARLAWTASQVGETSADDQPVHLVEYNPATGTKRTVGSNLDREMSYLDATHGVATGQNAGHSWVVLVDLTNGTRLALHAGSQPSVQPLHH